ncbi:hypothetical protein AR457_16905 [Streptomyces agglomeratus]|uniref:FG-GAP-like repeat-containing protein n=1 Tax=Streptomyces agglomeratus TaxID=285458 RepID=UPI000854BE60|nr:FG-GAP-like repeat-containing protein [Streptomyces agglomeratus]OEJ40056.1 hypothetical protein BGK70_19745 [Streptomyces agglomeratus]OEJ45565.1 hypothetical protein AR457_16905 [Streptomyces agglomeratus]
MKYNHRAVLAASVVAVLTGSLVTTATGTAAAAGSGVQSDFNGDGVRDLAVGAPGARAAGIHGAGAVIAYYGGSDGVSPARHTLIDQNVVGGPGSAESYDLFGAATATGDFDDDGFADLAVSSPREDVGGDANGGTVQILWGSAQGLAGGATVADPEPTRHDHFGAALAAGDFDGDGKDDLAVGSTSATLHVFKKGISKSGKPGAVTARGLPLRSATDAGIFNLTAGDVNKDGRADLVVNGLNRTASATDGKYHNVNYYLPGSADGPTAIGSRQMPGGVSGAIGDIDGDGFGDIVTGVYWGRATPDGAIGGKVLVNYGSANGPSTRTQTITQESGSIRGDSEDWDKFGEAVALGDIDGDGRMDLSVGTPRENFRTAEGMRYNKGTLTVLYGTSKGVGTGERTQYFHQASVGVPGSLSSGHQWGAALLMNDINGDGKSDVAVGSQWDDNGDGSVTVLPSDGRQASATVPGVVRLRGKEAGMDPVGYPQFGAALHNTRKVSEIASDAN